jgi:uncharacterized membrane protein YozB (DUF420 family)
MSKGFLGTAAPRIADEVLVAELSMGVALIVGMVLARLRHYRAHAWCQSAVVLLNLLPILGYMAPSFRRAVAPELPGGLGESYYWIATAHGVLGTAAEFLAVYIVLAAGTNVLPTRLRILRYKPWMRAALALWWIELVLGLALYVQWYGLPRRIVAHSTQRVGGNE